MHHRALAELMGHMTRLPRECSEFSSCPAAFMLRTPPNTGNLGLAAMGRSSDFLNVMWLARCLATRWLVDAEVLY